MEINCTSKVLTTYTPLFGKGVISMIVATVEVPSEEAVLTFSQRADDGGDWCLDSDIRGGLPVMIHGTGERSGLRKQVAGDAIVEAINACPAT